MCSEVLICEESYQKIGLDLDWLIQAKDMSNNSDLNDVKSTTTRRIIKKPRGSPGCTSEKGVEINNSIQVKHSEEQGLVPGDCQTKTSGPDFRELRSSLNIRKEVALVKSYAVLKDEMEETTAKSIASHLFGNHPQLLSNHDHECIAKTKGRRDVVEKLLKRVLIGGEALYDGFYSYIHAKETDIAIMLDETEVLESDIKVYKELKKSSNQKVNRSDSDKPRLKFSERDKHTLISSLNRSYFIDPLNDQLLSRLKISIREHDNVVNCSLDNETKVRTIIHTLELCDENVYEDVCRVLTSLKMEHVIKELEIGRKTVKKKYDSAIDFDRPRVSKKRKNLEQLDEPTVLKRVQKDGSHLDVVLQEKLDFTLEDVTEGSIVLQIKPKSQQSWSVLEEKCRSGEIKDFIPEVFRNEVENLKAGEHICILNIYVLTEPPNFGDRKALIELANPTIISKEIQDLVCEELKITEELLDKLREKHFVNQSIKEELGAFNRRKEKIRYVLEQLEMNGKEGYEFLKEYVKETNDYLYTKIKTEEGIKTIDKRTRTTGLKNSFSRSLERKGIVKELFFSADVVLVVGEKAETTSERKRSQSPVLQITCLKLIRQCCYFDESLDDTCVSLERKHSSLKDTWQYDSGSKTKSSHEIGSETEEEEGKINSLRTSRRAASIEDLSEKSHKAQKTVGDDVPVTRTLRRSKRRLSDKNKKTLQSSF